MARRSAIVTYYVDKVPEDLGNMVQVTLDAYPLPADSDHPKDRHIFEADPGHTTADDLPGTPATVTVIGSPWTIGALADAHPDAAPYVLDARYEDPDTGEVRRTREIAVPSGATVLETGLPSHVWAGDE